MPLFVWKDQYSVKVKDMDDQHIVLINLINDLHEAMKEGKGKQIQGKILDELIKYTKVHFSAEEELMQQNNYPGINEQKKQHEIFVSKMKGFLADHQGNKVMLSLEIMTFLRDWLLNHILKIDQKYSDFFNQKGIH